MPKNPERNNRITEEVPELEDSVKRTQIVRAISPANVSTAESVPFVSQGEVNLSHFLEAEIKRIFGHLRGRNYHIESIAVKKHQIWADALLYAVQQKLSSGLTISEENQKSLSIWLNNFIQGLVMTKIETQEFTAPRLEKETKELEVVPVVRKMLTNLVRVCLPNLRVRTSKAPHETSHTDKEHIHEFIQLVVEDLIQADIFAFEIVPPSQPNTHATVILRNKEGKILHDPRIINNIVVLFMEERATLWSRYIEVKTDTRSAV